MISWSLRKLSFSNVIEVKKQETLNYKTNMANITHSILRFTCGVNFIKQQS